MVCCHHVVGGLFINDVDCNRMTHNMLPWSSKQPSGSDFFRVSSGRRIYEQLALSQFNLILLLNGPASNER